MRHADEDDDADCSCVFFKTHTDVAVEERLPTLGCGKEDGDKHGADSADYGVEECGKGEAVMSALKLLDCFMKVDDAV